MTAYNIEWIVDVDEIYELIDNRQISSEVIAKLLNITRNSYEKLSSIERHEFIRDAIHHNRINAAELVGLPNEVTIPQEIGNDDEDIANWLSAEYEYCIGGFTI